MQSISDIVERIRAFAHQPGWSKARLASESGLHPNALRSLDEPDWSPRLDTLVKVEAAIERLTTPPPDEGRAA